MPRRLTAVRIHLLARLAAVVLLSRLTAAPAAETSFKVADQKSAPVADAVVALISLDAPIKKFAPPAEPLVIAQEKQQFVPYVTPLLVGTAVKFPNRDTVKHQVYSSSKPKSFELPLYAGEAREPIVFDHPGVVALGCNIHDAMIAYVVVLETPWFAKTGADGTATIAAVPSGRYRVEIWQPRLAGDKTVTREITIRDEAGAPVEFTLQLGRDRRIHRIPDAGGRGY